MSCFHHQVSLSSFHCPVDTTNISPPVSLITVAVVTQSSDSSSRPPRASQPFPEVLTTVFFFHFPYLMLCSAFALFFLLTIRVILKHNHPMLSGYTLSCHHLAVSNLLQIASSTQNLVPLCAPASAFICHPVVFPLLEVGIHHSRICSFCKTQFP